MNPGKSLSPLRSISESALTDSSEEADVLTGIWEQAIKERGDEVLEKYIDLLKYNHTSADVSLAESKITKTTAELIWRYLSRTAKGGIYYCEKHGDRV